MVCSSEFAARLEASLVNKEDAVIYLRADICRAELDVEIEATVVGALV